MIDVNRRLPGATAASPARAYDAPALRARSRTTRAELRILTWFGTTNVVRASSRPRARAGSGGTHEHRFAPVGGVPAAPLLQC
jgi:hypothetical protein